MFGLPKFQKDPEQQKLISSVYQQLSEIAQPYLENNNQNSSQQTVKFVSFEDALKELVSLKKS